MPDAAPNRLLSIDVFRGLTIAAMLLVNNPGDSANVFSSLRHSAWHGCTPADLVFPFFLFVVGITTHFSLVRHHDNQAFARRVIVRRTAIIFALGLLVNGFPFYENRAVAGPVWLPAVIGHVVARLAHLRLLGVLQRIAMAYLAASLIAHRASNRRILFVAALLLGAYWAAMT
ncbi:MAG: heparan-alpha-glucosaminide N-acetyltransferase domain-containing protein, partial [Gemmatimonadota bacterium]|nr:heparan-alpha-glucosaminide N-acetyltransferase domain-containing protein [Gemmatimonadota bacterium]